MWSIYVQYIYLYVGTPFLSRLSGSDAITLLVTFHTQNKSTEYQFENLSKKSMYEPYRGSFKGLNTVKNFLC